MSSTWIWYAARSAGLIAWALLAATVVWGLVRSTRLTGLGTTPAWVVDLHRFLGGLSLAFVGIHVGAILLDSYVHFGLLQVLVPFTATWHPVATAWGSIALWLLLAVEITALARRRLPRRLWRRVHYASLPLFVFATVHGLTAGTDRRTFGVLCGAVLLSAPVAVLLGRRLQRALPRPAVS